MTSELHVNESKRPIVKHDLPQLKKIAPHLVYDYIPSPSGIESNLLLLFHGLGDTCKPFSQLGKSLNLPQTAVLSIQAPGRVPLLEEEAFCWWPSFTELGELIPNPNPTETLNLLIKVLTHLTTPPTASSQGASSSESASRPTPTAGSAAEGAGPGWLPSQIHLFGFAQGGSCAGELALAWSRHHRTGSSSKSTLGPITTAPAPVTSTSNAAAPDGSSSPVDDLGSLVVVSAPLLSHPTVPDPSRSRTRVLLVSRGRTEQRSVVGPGSWRKGFQDVQEHVLADGGSGGSSMLRGQDEWLPVMRFWSTVLVQRSALELSAGVYEVRGGTAGVGKA